MGWPNEIVFIFVISSEAVKAHTHSKFDGKASIGPLGSLVLGEPSTMAVYAEEVIVIWMIERGSMGDGREAPHESPMQDGSDLRHGTTL